jgi:hypothetical protein
MFLTPLNNRGRRLPAEVQSLYADAVPNGPQLTKPRNNRGKWRLNAGVHDGRSRGANGLERTKMSQLGDVRRVGGPKLARNLPTAEDL